MKHPIEYLAQGYATGAHARIAQVRKYVFDPYIVHPRNVAYLVSLVTDDQNMIAAAWLHDVLEDVAPIHPEIFTEMPEIFGEDIYNLVVELTDTSKPEDGNRSVRKEIDRERLSRASARAQTIKMADLIDNTKSIVDNDHKFAKVYLHEKRLLLSVLDKGDPLMRAIAFDLLVRSEQKIEKLEANKI